ncbi:MAG: ATP-binding protein [Clostridium sp.]|nr:ATP-binding protein [Clostridium sp.]
MLLEELFETSYDRELQNKPYENEEEYRTDLFRFLDMVLSIACSTKYQNGEEGKPIEIENCHLRGVPITSSEVILALYGNAKDVIESYPFAEIREELQRTLAFIKSRKEVTKIPLSISELFERLSLTSFAQFLVLLAWANYYDAKYELLYAFLQGDVRMKLPSISLGTTLYELFAHVEPEEISRLKSEHGVLFGTMLEYREEYDSISLARNYTLSDGAYQWIQNDMSLHPVLQQYSIDWDEDKKLDGIRQNDLTLIKGFLEEFDNSKKTSCEVINVYGQRGNGRKQLVHTALDGLCRQAIYLDVVQMLSMQEKLEPVIRAIYQECEIKRKVVCLVYHQYSLEEEERSDLSSSKIKGFLKQCRRILPYFIWISEEKSQYLLELGIPYVCLEIKALSIQERNDIWEKEAKQYAVADGVDFGVVASQYLLSRKGIKDTLWNAEINRKAKKKASIGVEDIQNAIKQQSANQLGRSAQLIPSVYTWDSLVLPEEQLKQLSMICNHVKYQNVVGEKWGFYEKTAYGRGVCALFYGAPGTGKTMAVQVLANELGLNLYRIDLSQLMSKYIGETEKNISKVFRKARGIHALLFFDEADSLFAKRLEVKDSLDRSANAQTAHLLQEIEAYEGLTILATNLANNLDDAFKRRIKFMVKFPFPKMEERLRLWEINLPEKVPLEEPIDFPFLAEKFELTGSSIKEIVTFAAYLAASEHRGLRMSDVIEGLKYSYTKYGKMLTNREIEHFM